MFSTCYNPTESQYPQGSITSLDQAAAGYSALGWSVIPLVGEANPTRAKQPAIGWTVYQQQAATYQQIQDWFSGNGYRALGIVTGAVSALVVLDFDRTDLYLDFAHECPDFIDTWTVKTARGRHLYFHLPAGVKLPSRKIPGLDVQGEGRYVVAPPSVINGIEYTVINKHPARTLSHQDAQRITAFLNTYKPVTPPETIVSSTVIHQPLSEQYRALIAQAGGRNTALYQLSRRLKGQGQTEAETAAALIHLHAAEPAPHGHHHESYEQRLAEATRTIHSAYQAHYHPPLESNMPDQAIREHLLQRDVVEGTAFLRVYEGLLRQGVQPEDALTFKTIYAHLKPLGIGRPAIERALRASGPGGALFTPSPTTPTPLNTEYSNRLIKKSAETEQTPKNGVHTTNPTKTQKLTGRPAKMYLFPGQADLCHRLGVRPAGGGDVVESAALHSPGAYRQALERAFIKRRPGKYHLGLLAARLGVSARTIQRYHAESDVQSLPTYERLCGIGWLNLDDLPTWKNGQPSKFCLQDERGKRYRARPETAVWLLRRGRQVTLMQRGANFYWVDEPPFAVLARQQADIYGVQPTAFELCAHRLSDHLQQVYTITGRIDPKQLPRLVRAAERGEGIALHQQRLFPAEEKKKPKLKPKPKRYFRRPLPDQRLERLARRLHVFSSPGQHGLSLVNARRLVETYGYDAVEGALKKAQWMIEHQAGSINKIGGFLITVSRVLWREQHPDARGAAIPQFHAEKRAQRKRGYVTDEDAAWCLLREIILFMDADYLAWRANFWAAQGLADAMLTEIAQADSFKHETLPEEMAY